MNITERAAIVLQEIDAALAMAEKPIGDEENLNRLAAKYDVEDLLEERLTGVTKSREVQTDLRAFASFIAASRTLLPKTLRGLKTAIKGMLKQIEDYEGAEIQPNGYVITALNAVCELWKEQQ